jgi:hypothetical protein
VRRDPEQPMDIYTDQLEQHRRTAEELQKANCMAAQLLLKLWRGNSGERDRQVGTQLVRLAGWMNLLMDDCERIVAGTPSGDLTLNIVVHTQCLKCHQDARANRTAPRPRPGGLLSSDEAWAHQVQSLLEHATQVARHSCRRR